MIFCGALLRLLYRTGGAVGAARLAGAHGRRPGREYRLHNSRNICAVDSRSAVDH